MSGPKFFVWGGGRWREVSPSGRVSGWGRARFVAASGGRLARCRRNAVLRGLRALAAGTPTTVHDGPPLPQIRLQIEQKVEVQEPPRCRCGRGPEPAPAPPAPPAAPAPVLHFNTEEIFNRLLKSTTTGQRAATVDAGVQVAPPAPPPDTRDTERPLPEREYHVDRKHERLDKNQNYEKSLKPKRKSKITNGVNDATFKRGRSSSEDSGVTGGGRKRARRRGSLTGEEGEEEGETGVCKELVIGEEDVALLRQFVERHDGVPFPVDLLRYDEDDDYKRRVFFRLNPIVNVTRCSRVRRMLRAGRSRTRELRSRSRVSLRDFASLLGLQSVEERSSQDTDGYRTRNRVSLKRKRARSLGSSDTDKENASEPRTRPARLSRPSRPDRAVRALANNVVDRAGDAGKRTPLRRKVKDNENGRILSDRPLRAGPNAPNKATDKATNKALHKVTNKALDKAPDKATNKAPDKATNKATDKAPNKAPDKAPNKAPDKAPDKALDKTPVAPITLRPRPATAEKRSGGREYSALEDAAIVQWVAAGGAGGGGRSRLVNGNRLWRELQPLHHQRTGHFRSWHSLRNRYLRSLLPRLALHVSAADATRLRADAAIGELKSRKSRRNSIFNEARVRSAWSRRLRSPRRSPSPPGAQSPARYTPSPPGARSTSSSDQNLSSGDSMASPRLTRNRVSHPTTAGELKRALRSSAVKAPPRARTPTLTYKELTRRFASRSSRSPSTSRSPRRARAFRNSRSKTRRLYNPNLPV